MPNRKRLLKPSEKILFLQEIREHLLLSPEEYRLLVQHVLRSHAQQRRRPAPARIERMLADAV